MMTLNISVWTLCVILILLAGYSCWIHRDKKDTDWKIKVMSSVVIALLLLFINIEISKIEHGITIHNSDGKVHYTKTKEIPKEEE